MTSMNSNMQSKHTQMDVYGEVLKTHLNIYFCYFCKSRTRENDI